MSDLRPPTSDLAAWRGATRHDLDFRPPSSDPRLLKSRFPVRAVGIGPKNEALGPLLNPILSSRQFEPIFCVCRCDLSEIKEPRSHDWIGVTLHDAVRPPTSDVSLRALIASYVYAICMYFYSITEGFVFYYADDSTLELIFKET